MNLRHAEKLLALYARQIEVLDKHRGKGQQQMTVKYVNVQSGGQAVVGNVRSAAPSRHAQQDTATPPALTDQSGTAMGMDLAPTKEKASTRRKK